MLPWTAALEHRLFFSPYKRSFYSFYILLGHWSINHLFLLLEDICIVIIALTVTALLTYILLQKSRPSALKNCTGVMLAAAGITLVQPLSQNDIYVHDLVANVPSLQRFQSYRLASP